MAQKDGSGTVDPMSTAPPSTAVAGIAPVEEASSTVGRARRMSATTRVRIVALALLLGGAALAGLALNGTFATSATTRSANQEFSGGVLALTNGVTTLDQAFGPLAPGDSGRRIWVVKNGGTLDITNLTLTAPAISYSDSVAPSSAADDLTSQLYIVVDWCPEGFNEETLTCPQWSTLPLYAGTLENLELVHSLNLPDDVLAAPNSPGARDLPLRIRYTFSVDPPDDIAGGTAVVRWRLSGTQAPGRDDL